VSQAAVTVFRRLTMQDTHADFRCERDPGMVEFLATQAWQHEQRGFARTFVLDDGDLRVVGFYCLSAARMVLTDVPKTNDPPSDAPRQLPMILIGQVARHDEALGHWRSAPERCPSSSRRRVGVIGLLGSPSPRTS
jgi:hypothetical protein